MADYLIQDSTLLNIANAIREKTGKSDDINVSDMASEIASITVGSGDSGSVSGSSVTGTVSARSDATSLAIPCTFIPSKIFMYCVASSGISYDYNASFVVYDNNTLILFIDPSVKTDDGYSVFNLDDRLSVDIELSGNYLCVDLPKSIEGSTQLTYHKGTWKYIAIE